MKPLLYLLLLSPLWAAIATWLMLQIFSSCIACIIYLIGLLRGIVRRKTVAIGLAVMIVQTITFAGFFWLSAWLFESVFSVGETKGQKIILWFVAILIAASYLKEIIQKIKQNWIFAHVPGAAEEYAWKLKLLRMR
jgi:hypothetical protein